MTIKDVAESAGVSVSTVSRVLNGHPDVSEAARTRVLQAVRALHYVPNKSAQDLARPQTDSIGVVVRGAENPFFIPIISAIEQACTKAGYTMVLNQIPTSEDEVVRGAELVGSKRLKGLVLLGGRFDYTQEVIASLGVPFVCCSYTNHFGNLSDDDFASVTIDDVATAKAAVNHLIAAGHTKIAALLDKVDDRSICELRYRGYCEALAAAGLLFDPDLVVQSVDYSMTSAYERMSALLARRHDFTAVFSISDTLAMAGMKAVVDAGLSCPQDISFIGIDGIEISKFAIPTLTTLAQPQEELGREAIRILVNMLEGRASERHIQLKTKLRSGGTVATID